MRALLVLAALGTGCARNAPEDIVRDLLDIANARDCTALRQLTSPYRQNAVDCSAEAWPALYDLAVGANIELDKGGHFDEQEDIDVATFDFPCSVGENGWCEVETEEYNERWYLVSVGPG